MAVFYQVRQAEHQLRVAERDRHAQLLTDLSRRWDESPLIDCRILLMEFPDDGAELRKKLERLEENRDPEFHKLMVVANFFEDLGILVAEEILPLDLVKKSLAGPAQYQFHRYRPFIGGVRQSRGRPELYRWFEYLATAVAAED